MFQKKQALLFAMSLLTINAGNAIAEQVKLPVKKACYTSYSHKLSDGKQLVALRIGGHQALVSFNTDLLKHAVKFKIKEATLKLGTQYVDKRKDGSGKAPLIKIYPLLKDIKGYKIGSTLKLKAGVDYVDKALISYQIPDSIKRYEEITIKLPAENSDELIKTLSKGLLFKLVPKGKPSIFQVNLYSYKAPSKYRSLAMGIDISFESEVAKLDLHPYVRPRKGHYVTRKGADFYYDGKPIHLMGLNVGAGCMTSYEAIDNAVLRLRNMNINSIRLWATGHPFYTPESTRKGNMVRSKKGDNSKLDRYDYLVYKLQEAGIFVHCTSLGSHGPPMQYWPGNKIVLKRKNKHYDHNYYNVFPIMPYLDKTFKDAKIAHIKMYLNRINPYNKQRYAEMPLFASWELANENHTVAFILDGRFEKWPSVFKQILTKRWNEWLKKKYKNNSALAKAWGKLNKGENLAKGNIYPAPTYKQATKYPEKRASDFINCVQDLFINASKEFEVAARSCAPKGIGINTAPIVANTHADLNMHAQYASSVCDFVSVGAYQTPFTVDKKKPFYPWRPIFSERPYFYNLNFQTVKDKPFVVYENSFFRPYAYRVEWMPAIALLGAGLGWDSIYYYIFGQTWAITDQKFTGLGFMTKALKTPTKTTHDGYCYGFHHGNDEIMMASIAVSAQAFINGIKPNKTETVVTYGKSAIHNPAYKNYSPGGPAAKVPNRDRAGGETEWFSMPNIYRKFMHTSVRKRLQLAFDEKQKAPIKIKGNLVEKTSGLDEDREKLTSSPDIIWNPQKNQFILDCAHSKIATGILKNGYKFNDGVTLSPVNRNFAMFGISSRDGKALAQSEDIIVTIVNKSHNTGFKYDPAKIKGSTIGHIKGVVNRGTAPVIVKRVKADITVPVKGKTMRCYNFAGYCYRTVPVNGKISFSADEPLFVAIITNK